MNELTYSFRLSLFRKETTYRLADHALLWSEGERNGALEFAEIRRIRIYESPGAQSMPPFSRCVITPKAGRSIILSSNHFAGVGEFEVRMDRFQPFVQGLIARVAGANPAVEFIAGMPMGLWVSYVVILAALVVITPLGVALMIFLSRSGEHVAAGFTASLAICLGFLFSIGPLWRLVRRNRPQVFDPRATGAAP